MRKIFLFAVCSILSFEYIGILSNLPKEYWLHYTQKPFIFRCLIPLLARDGVGILVLVSLFCSGLILVMLYVYGKYWIQSLRNDVAFITVYFLITMFLTKFSNYYDFPSAFFFLLLFILFDNKKYLVSIPVFILACLNRETTILLIPVLLLMSRKFSLAILFVAIFLAVRLLVIYAFSDASGEAVYNNLLDNLARHADRYIDTIIMVVAGLGLVVLVIVNSPYLPTNILIFIGIVLPALVGVYLVVGVRTEIRVFAEVMPLFFMSALMKPKRDNIYNHSLLQILNIRDHSYHKKSDVPIH